MMQNHIKTKINVFDEMNHGNETNVFLLVCLMENGHSILKGQSLNLLLEIRVKIPGIQI